MKRHRISFFALISLYALYNLIGAFYTGSEYSITTVLVFLYLLICGIYMIKTLRLPITSHYVKIWMLFLLVNVISFLFIPDQNLINVNRLGFSVITIFKTILVVLLSFFPFYYLANQRLIGDKTMRNVFVIFLIVSIIGYFVDAVFVRTVAKEGESSQVNAIYGVVYLVPFIFFIKRKLSIYIIISMLFLLVLSSLKRGAFISFSLGCIILLYWTTRGNMSKTNLLQKITGIFLISTFAIVAYYITMAEKDFVQRFIRISTDGGSNRNVIYETLLFTWLEKTNYYQLIFGFGFAGTINFVYSFAHNDLLEVAVNYGLIGLVVYILLWKNLFNIYRNLEKLPIYKFCLLAILLMWVVDSMYHRFFSGLYSTPTVMVIGYIVGKYELIRSNSVSGNMSDLQEPVPQVRD